MGIPTASENPRLRFWHWFSFRPADDDWGKVQIKVEGSSEWTNDWACVITFLNQDQAETATWAENIAFEVEGNSSTCKIGNQIVSVDFNY